LNELLGIAAQNTYSSAKPSTGTGLFLTNKAIYLLLVGSVKLREKTIEYANCRLICRVLSIGNRHEKVSGPIRQRLDKARQLLDECSVIRNLSEPPSSMPGYLIRTIVVLCLQRLKYCQRILEPFIPLKCIEHLHIAVESTPPFIPSDGVIFILHDVTDVQKLCSPFFELRFHVHATPNT